MLEFSRAHAFGMFQFKQFVIHQEKAAMKVGTDAVLLGSWADTARAVRALDVGTGTGILALMIAQCNATVEVDAIDLDAHAIEQARDNAMLSPWNNRIHIMHTDLRRYCLNCKTAYDLIICNPPFFSRGFPVADTGRRRARVAENLDPALLIHSSKQLLAADGKLAVILPAATAADFTGLALLSTLYCSRKTTVYSRADKPPIRILLEFKKQPVPLHEESLIIAGNVPDSYSEEYRKLTRDFYLHF